MLMASFSKIRNVTECTDSGLVSWRTGFSHSAIHVGFVADKVVVGMVSLQGVWLFPVSVTPTCVPSTFFQPSMTDAVISTFDVLLNNI